MRQESPTPLTQLVQVGGRFHRSVQLPQDFEPGSAPSNYFASPAILDIARQILSELSERHGARAWTLTGPYGTGKSAFALFLANILAAHKPTHPDVRNLRREHRHRARLMQPLLIQADRGPLLPDLLDTLTAAGRASGDRTVVRRSLALSRGREPDPTKVVELLSQTAERSPGGLVLMVDELGKYLEYAAQRSDEEDLYLLQQIAEAAARCRKPLLFLAVLHSGFADYLQGSSTARRAEWQKVQGRFRDIPFSLPDDQMLGLVRLALRTRFTGGIRNAYRERFESFTRSPGFSRAAERTDDRNLLAGCLPLHPAVSLILWPLFRSKVAQNERSLFAFLTSHEPHGFQEFLQSAATSPALAPLYDLPRLYDYVTGALGLASITGRDARQWSLMASALDRVPAAAPPVARDLVKCIGLLSVYGGRPGLQPTEELLHALFADRPQDGDTGESIAFLQRESIALFRRHTGSFTLWEGSDIDLEAELETARRHQGNRSLSVRLQRTALPRPLVPRRHYIETGTLRWLEVCVVGTDSARRICEGGRETRTDGLVLMLAAPELTPRAAVDRARILSHSGPGGKPHLAAIPRNLTALADALDELEGWEWVRTNVPELAGDAVARQEVAARLEAARLGFERLAGPVFGLPGHVLDPSVSRWFHDGREISGLSDPASLQSRLSRICSDVFHGCPPLRNELLNRSRLSSASARARRELIERIIETPQEKNLGIQGFPPHFAMYQSLLKAGGFHGTCGLGPPTKKEWRPVWEEIERFLDSTRAGPLPVTDLMDALKRPPFGMRDGPLPVLVAVTLAIKGEEAALYEDGVFVSDAITEAMERLVRRPETFSLGSHRLDSAETELLRTLDRTGFVTGNETLPRGLLGTVRRLVGLVASLPPYARRTRRISSVSQAVRERLLQAKDPRALMFQELPKALGFRLARKDAAKLFANALAEATRELVGAFPGLLDEVEETTRQVFGAVASGEELRRHLRDRASVLVQQATGAASVFVRTLAMTDSSRDWREDVARAVGGGKPPTHWSDAEARAFPVRVRTLAVEMERIESLLTQRGKDASAKVFRLEVLASEKAQLFSGMLAGETSAPVKSLADRLNRTARDSGLDDRSQLTALLVAAVRAHAEDAGGTQAIRERSA